MTRAFVCVLGALLLGPLLKESHGRVQCTDTPTCLRVIDVAQTDTRTVIANFVQVKHLSLLDQPLVSTGRFMFKRPDRIRLQIEKPQPATVVIDGGDVQVPGLPERDRHVLAAAPMAAMFAQLAAIFSGSVPALEDNFEVVARQDSGGIQVTLVPHRDAWKRVFQLIELRFTAPELVLQEMRFEDALGDWLEITLHDVQRNQHVPDSVFEQ